MEAYFRYGTVENVLVAHSRVKPRPQEGSDPLQETPGAGRRSSSSKLEEKMQGFIGLFQTAFGLI